MADKPKAIIPPDQVEGETKEERVASLANRIVGLMRAHPRRHEAFDALDVARIFFRPGYPPTVVEDQASESQSHAGASESLEAIQ